MDVCNAHFGFVVVMDKSLHDSCPVCEIIQDNFRMRLEILGGLANYDVGHLPKYLQKIFKQMIKRAKKGKN